MIEIKLLIQTDCKIDEFDIKNKATYTIFFIQKALLI